MLKNILIVGVAAVAVIGAAVVSVKNNKKEKETEDERKRYGNRVDEFEDEDVSDTPVTVIDKVKATVQEKSYKAMVWCMQHMEELDALGSIIGIGATIVSTFSIGYEYGTYKRMKTMEEKLDLLLRTAPKDYGRCY